MATPPNADNGIKASDIAAEFGYNVDLSKVSLRAYRVSQTVGALSNLPLDTGIPQSGAIKYSDFINKRLNIVVNYYSGGNETRPQSARERYDAANTQVVGGFKGRPSNPAGHKVKIHVNKTISGGTGTDDCALRTGDFGNTGVSIDVGGSGAIYGAGGNGGEGGENSGSGTNGGNGTSAIGIQQNSCEINVMSGGIISAGYGGGGGGGGDHQRDKGESRNSSGGGGGGGAGSPAGVGGNGGEGGADGANGANGTNSSGGDGGNGGSNDNQARAGEGGEGGDHNGNATNGEGGDHYTHTGANAGGNGQAFRATMSINQFHPNLIHNSGTIRGDTSYSTTVT